MLNAAFAPELRRALLAAARRSQGAARSTSTARCGCSTSARRPASRPSSCSSPTTQGWDELAPRLGLAQGGDQPWRRAEARLIADRLRQELDDGRRAGDMVVLVRATASLRLLEEALEEQGLPTYVVGGRGYWSQEQVRDGLAWLRVLANPHDEEALLTVLSSPFHGAGTDELVLLTQDGRAPAAASGTRCRRATARWRACWPPSASTPQRAPLEVLLERAIVATGLRPRDAGAARRRPPAREPAQADAARGRVRARRGPRPARLPRRRRRRATSPRRARARPRWSPRAWTPCG